MLKIYNSLSRKVEVFKPLKPPTVGMYACGPTVYDFAHIGNFRTYTVSDFLLRTLQYNGYDVQYIMNLTDVGHLTGDNLGDADMGEDRMEKSAAREGKTAWEVAAFYTEAFLKDFKALNLIEPVRFAKATDHIKEQIDLVKRLEEKGFTYQTSDGIYFDTGKFPEYGKLSNLDEIKAGARVEINPEKRNPRDFALWKFSYPGSGKMSSWSEAIGSHGDSGDSIAPPMAGLQNDKKGKRHMEWKSPWGVGFPGWHIECSAMAMKYLGESFDVHIGGVDLRETHHPNEIAQAEAVTGRRFVKYWVHSAFVLVQGERMSKSLGNNYKLYDLQDKGFDPLALRYLYLQTHYRQEMNFTFPALESAQQALNHLRSIVVEWDKPEIGCAEYEEKFLSAINDDLNFPEALAIVWDMVKSDYPSSAKAQSVFKFDNILGLKLSETKKTRLLTLSDLPEEVQFMVTEREKLRKEKSYTKADHLRNRIKKLGYDIRDSAKGIEIKKIEP